jgi:hypothetical protein
MPIEMTSLFTYLLELNIVLVILYAAYKIIFERDKNFKVRRVYLFGVILLPFMLPVIPDAARISFGGIAPVTITLDEITIFGEGSTAPGGGSIVFWDIMAWIYLGILALGILKLCIQLASIYRAVRYSERLESQGSILLSHPSMHASSFFGYVFIDPEHVGDKSFRYIVEHENIHKREWHSVDRMLVELFVMINWFNPVAWLFRRSVIENLEYLADSAMIRRGTDTRQYQLSILNQYIGSASITNQFSSQIKKRINMLNKDYKLGSSWKLIMFIPLLFLAFILVSCTEKDTSGVSEEPGLKKSAKVENKIYRQVEDMPTFQGGNFLDFRKYIAKNIKYPKQAVEAGASGKVFVTFIVRHTGKVDIPEINELPPPVEGEEDKEVVVVGYRPTDKDSPVPDEKYIDLLKEEAVRVVVSSSTDWGPGKVDGKPVDVMFTFPIVFALQ